MAFKQKLAKVSGIKATKLPSSYQIIGDVLLFKLPKLRQEQKEKIAAATMTLLPYVKTVCEIKEIKGELREPEVVKLAGGKTETVHKENDILYKIDVSQIMFSKGNLSERKRLIPQVKEGEIIIDMFAGIGYFSLGIAKFTKAKEIMAIEKNPVAYNFLTDNILLNKINNINAIQGDCKTFAMSFKDYADRVIMGYFPGTEDFLDYAIFMARNNCTIHFHNIYKIKDLWKKPLQQIEEACKKANVSYEILVKKKVKSYSPSTWHVVIDFRVIK
ncbi:MAG: class I SAM-dependent methyltransferase family protein [Candidatus Aenigmarchaeota archaeon]|nr:class I SAM-dependent methyltransferase family protein [Candidatus Aenigmarchaeota archaeon]